MPEKLVVCIHLGIGNTKRNNTFNGMDQSADAQHVGWLAAAGSWRQDAAPRRQSQQSQQTNDKSLGGLSWRWLSSSRLDPPKKNNNNNNNKNCQLACRLFLVYCAHLKKLDSQMSMIIVLASKKSWQVSLHVRFLWVVQLWVTKMRHLFGKLDMANWSVWNFQNCSSAALHQYIPRWFLYVFCQSQSLAQLWKHLSARNRT